MMKKFILASAVALIFSAVFPSFAAAQQQGYGQSGYGQLDNYVEAKLGGYSPISNELTDYSTGFNGEAAFGHYFSRYFATEFGVGHLHTDGTVLVTQGQLSGQLATEDIDATYMEATAKAVFPFPYFYSRAYGPAGDLYIGAGLGVYFAEDNVDAIDYHVSDTVPGFQIVGGTDFNLNRNVFLGFELKYMYAKPFDTDIEGMIFSFNAGYRF